MNKKNLHKLLENLATGNTDAAAKNLSKELRKISIGIVNEIHGDYDYDYDPPDNSEDYTYENVTINSVIDGQKVNLVFDCTQSVVWDHVPATFDHDDESEIVSYGEVKSIISKTFSINDKLIFSGNELFEDMTPFSKHLQDAFESVKYAINWAIENDDVELGLNDVQITELSKKIVLAVKDIVDDMEDGRYSG